MHLAQQPQGFSEALTWERASQEGSQTSQPCQTAQGLRRQAQSTGQPHFKTLGSSVTSEWKPGHLSPEKQIPCPLWLSRNYSLLLLVLSLSLNFPAHSFLTGESQCMPLKFSGRLWVQQPDVYTISWSFQGEIWISLLNFKSFWTFSISDKSYPW